MEGAPASPEKPPSEAGSGAPGDGGSDGDRRSQQSSQPTLTAGESEEDEQEQAESRRRQRSPTPPPPAAPQLSQLQQQFPQGRDVPQPAAPSVNPSDPSEWRTYIQDRDRLVPIRSLAWDLDATMGQIRKLKGGVVKYYLQQLYTKGEPLKPVETLTKLLPGVTFFCKNGHHIVVFMHADVRVHTSVYVFIKSLTFCSAQMAGTCCLGGSISLQRAAKSAKK